MVLFRFLLLPLLLSFSLFVTWVFAQVSQINLTTLLMASAFFAPALPQEPPIDPVPRVKKAYTLHTWDFQNGTEGWEAEHQCSLAARDGRLLIESTGTDPYFHAPVDFEGGQMVVELRVRNHGSSAGGPTSIPVPWSACKWRWTATSIF